MRERARVTAKLLVPRHKGVPGHFGRRRTPPRHWPSGRWRRAMRLAGLLLPVVSGFVLFSPWGRIEQDGLTDPYLSPNLEIEWSGPESFDLYETVFLWSMPANALSQDGLGGGITWALHPRFCEQILPMFPEASPAGTFATFLTCADLRHAVASAFNTWADNHEKITFLDVTDRCVNMTGTNCASAEVVVQVYEASLTEAMRTQLDSGSVDFTPRLTSGVTLPQGLGLNRAWINVSSASCWYLDETFCYTFHQVLRAGRRTPARPLSSLSSRPRLLFFYPLVLGSRERLRSGRTTRWT